MKRLLLVILIVVLVATGYILFNTITFPSRQLIVEPVPHIEVPESSIENFSRALSIPTVSHEDPLEFDSAAFYAFRSFVKEAYPLTDSLLEVTYINEFSIMVKWQGSDPGLKPFIMLGHIDVVPVDRDDVAKWSVPPFSGEVKDGKIWGRGAIDDKISVIGNLEAVEMLLQEGFQPGRSLYLCFGHDEEIGGYNGAVAIVDHLKNLNVEAEFILDEGFAITQGMVPGMEKDVALIGTAEKGFLSLELAVSIEGGHSSMPAGETAIDVLARAVVKLKDDPFPSQISPPVRDFMAYAGPEMSSFTARLAFANPGIFRPIIIGNLENEPSGNALVRTTTAPTIFRAGIKDNIIPHQARATVNFRTLPGTSIADVKERVARIIDDGRITITEGPFSSESPGSSSVDTFGYETINRSIKEIFPEVIVAPNLVIGATDSRHYYPISDAIYRFVPFYLNKNNITTFHGIDEHLAVEDYKNSIRFYKRLIVNATSSPLK
jgi:carboxypeptidase PM20D1